MINIGIIGIGKVGLALTQFFATSKRSTTCVMNGMYSRDHEYSGEIAAKYKVINYIDSEDLVEACDVVFIATSDNEISNVVDDIAHMNNIVNRVFIHCSGALSSEIFSPLINKGALGYSLHPLKAFTGYDEDRVGLETCYLTLEGNMYNDVEQSNINSVLEFFEGRYSWIETDKKVLYHAAAVMISNYSVTVVNEGYKYLQQIGFSEDTIGKMMIPLLEGTVNNIKYNGTINGLTGPIIRGDDQTIQKHLNALDKYMKSEDKEFYKLMGYKTLDMIKDYRLNQETYEKLKHLFA